MLQKNTPQAGGHITQLALDREDLASVVVAAARADVVRELLTVALGALGQVGGGQRVVAAAHVALALAGLLLGNGVLSHIFSPGGAARRVPPGPSSRWVCIRRGRGRRDNSGEYTTYSPRRARLARVGAVRIKPCQT